MQSLMTGNFNRWAQLSQKEKAELIRLYADNGIVDLNDIMNDYNEFKSGGSIRIDPKNKGKFNATKKRTGKTTEELTHSKNPLTRKRAIFAQNSRRWRHADGGTLANILDGTAPVQELSGGDWSFSGAQDKLLNTVANNLQETYPEVYREEDMRINPAVVTADLPKKFNGSQDAAQRYAEGYRFSKNISDDISKIGTSVANDMVNVAQYIPGPIGATVDAAKFGIDVISGDYKNALKSAALTAGTYGIGKGIKYVVENPAILSALNNINIGKMRQENGNYYRILANSNGVEDAFATGVYRGNPKNNFGMPYFSKDRFFAPVHNGDAVIKINEKAINSSPEIKTFKISEPHTKFGDIKFPEAFDLSDTKTTDAFSFLTKGKPDAIPMSIGNIYQQKQFLGIPYTEKIFDIGGNIFSGKDKNQPTQKLKRVDLNEWYKVEGNRNRPVNIPAMEQLQDSLIARQWGLPQRLAILATAAQEMDERGAASRGVGGNGYLGLSFERMPEEYLDDSPKGRGRQINYIFEDLLTTHPDNWLNGGTGGPRIISGKDGFNQFWNSDNVWNATQVLNKSYIRPAGRLDSWNNRAGVAKAMQKHLKADGGFADFIKEKYAN